MTQIQGGVTAETLVKTGANHDPKVAAAIGQLAGRVVEQIESLQNIPSSLRGSFPELESVTVAPSHLTAVEAKGLSERTAKEVTGAVKAIADFRVKGEMPIENRGASIVLMSTQKARLESELKDLNAAASKPGGALDLYHNRFDPKQLSPRFLLDIADDLKDKSQAQSGRSRALGIETVAVKIEKSLRAAAHTAHLSILKTLGARASSEAYKSEQQNPAHYKLGPKGSVVRDFVMAHLPSTLTHDDEKKIADFFIESRKLKDSIAEVDGILSSITAKYGVEEAGQLISEYASIDDVQSEARPYETPQTSEPRPYEVPSRQTARDYEEPVSSIAEQYEEPLTTVASDYEVPQPQGSEPSLLESVMSALRGPEPAPYESIYDTVDPGYEPVKPRVYEEIMNTYERVGPAEYEIPNRSAAGYLDGEGTWV